MKLLPLLFGSLAFALPALADNTMTFNGNGAAGFNGSVGNGALTISNNTSAGSFTFTLSNTNSGQTSLSGNDLVLYIDSTTGGVSDTSTFTDNGDGGREAISGYNAGNGPSRTTATFATGFQADYAIAIAGNFIGLFKLDNASNFTYIAGNTPANGDNSPYSATFTAAQLGLTASSTSFNFVGSLISTTAYRSNETIGTITDASSNPGFSGGITFTNFDTYSTVPEPGTVYAGAGAVALAGLTFWRRRRAA